MNQDRFDVFNHMIASSAKSIQRLKVIGMLPHGLTGAHTLCLRHLYNHPEGLTRTKIVRLCDIDKAQVSRVINELCSKGYVIETENENINYRKRLNLTPMGKDTTAQINKLILCLNSFVSDDIPEEDIAVFYKTFEIICNRLKEAEALLEEKLAADSTD